MSKPHIHARSSVRKWKGKEEDYLPIHQLMDSSKGAFPDNRHRALTHNSWFIQPDGILEKIFGVTITNSDGKVVSVRDIGEQHILEDFKMKFIPTVADYLQEMEFQPWMQNGDGFPPSHKKIAARRVEADVASKSFEFSEPTVLNTVQAALAPKELEVNVNNEFSLKGNWENVMSTEDIINSFEYPLYCDGSSLPRDEYREKFWEPHSKPLEPNLYDSIREWGRKGEREFEIKESWGDYRKTYLRFTHPETKQEVIRHYTPWSD